MSSGLRFNFHYPEPKGPAGDFLLAGAVGAVAACAESAGFDGVSLSDHPAPGRHWLERGGHQTLDPLVALAFAAATTRRLRLITHLIVGPYRRPLQLAKAAATLDLLSNGRLVLGLGVGYMAEEYRALGVDYDERNVLFDEMLEVLPLHWSGEPFTSLGGSFDAVDVVARPTPCQRPIPIWIGGNSPLSRRRAATRAQGWMPMIGGPELAAHARTTSIATVAEAEVHIREVSAAADAAGRTAELDFMVPYVAGRDLLDDPHQHLDAFGRLAEAGMTWVTVSTPSVDRGATARFIEGFGELYLFDPRAAESSVDRT